VSGTPSTRRAPLRAALAGSLLAPAALLVGLLALGYDPRFAGPSGVPSPVSLALLVVPTAAVGAGAALALRHGVRLTPPLVVGAYAYAATTGLFAGGPPRGVGSFAAANLLLSTTGLLAVAAEFAARRRRAVRAALSPGALRWALAVGTLHALVLVGVRTALFEAPLSMTPFATLLTLWLLVGATLLGATPAYLAVRSRLVVPAALVAALSAGGLAVTVRSELARRATVEVGATIGPSPLTAYLVGWLGPLALALLAGLVEYVVRSRSGLAPPRPLRVRSTEE
jgi:hypothetical protein